MKRREFLQDMLALSTAGGLAGSLLPQCVLGGMPTKTLWLAHAHTNEELRTTFWRDGAVDVQGYRQICHMMRDFHVDKAAKIDLNLIGLLYAVQLMLRKNHEVDRPLVLLSGFRTKATNQRLEGAAPNSMHLYGKAADIHIPGVSTERLAAIGRQLRRGGVGTYLRNGFVHLDTGRVRYWSGSGTASAQSGRPARDTFDPRDDKWKNANRDRLDIMIQRWRRKRRGRL